MQSALYHGNVRHTRLRPHQHRFQYACTSWLIDLDELASLDQFWPLLGVNRAALISFWERDYGPSGDGGLKARIIAALEALGLDPPRRITLLCNPRSLGYGFNSLAVFFCYDGKDQLQTTLYEVSNTRGERHLYVAPAAAGSSPEQHQHCDKGMYVSPFMPMATHYHFRTRPPEARFRIVIHQHDADGPLFSASWQGQQQPLSRMAILRQLLRPMAIKTTLAIHWQALRIWLKGVPLQPFDRTGSYQISFAPSEREPLL